GPDGLDAGDAAARSRGAEPGPAFDRRRRRRRPGPLGLRSRTAQCVLQPGQQRGALHPRRRQHRTAPGAQRRRRRGALGARQRLWHSRHAPAAPDRALLPRLGQPFARERRHRPGPGHRQARARPAPGAPAHRERGRPGQRVLLRVRARARAQPRSTGMNARSRPRAPVHDPLLDPALYANRELSQLDFNFRVLAQAQDPSVPLLERLRFLCISCTNLDEFFEIRAATVRHALDFDLPLAPDALPPQVVLKRIHERAAELVAGQYKCWNEVLRPALAEAGVRVLARDHWNARQSRWLRKYFREEILPVLSPLGLDPAHPFPKILNKSLNIVVVLKGKDAFGRAGNLAIVRAPRSLPRIIQLPPSISGGDNDFVFLSAMLSAFVDELFPGMEVKGAYQFRVTRNSELIVDEEEVENLALALRDELVGRGYLRAMRLEIARNCPRPIVRTLLENFELAEEAVYRIDGPVNLNRVIQVYDMVQRPELKYPPFQPRKLPGSDAIFERVRDGDVLLHHPYDAFTPVLELVKQAAEDPNVLAIKQTLYRTGKDSAIVEALVQAARNGKDVTAVIELRARFDEEANLGFADRLQDAGVQVVYGVVGFKTHAKMLLVVRREGRKLRRYVHLGTGNYHAGTARTYTDLGLITCNEEIGGDVHQIFQQLSGMAPATKLKRL